MSKKSEKKSSRVDRTSDSQKELLTTLRKQVELATASLGITQAELFSKLSTQILFPISCFSTTVSALEIIVLYLRQNKGLKNNTIATVLNRNQKTISQAYIAAVQKHPGSINDVESRYHIPVEILSNRKFSVLEHIVCYLKSTYGLSFRDIAKLLHRNDRTIWTVYHRALKKGDHYA